MRIPIRVIVLAASLVIAGVSARETRAQQGTSDYTVTVTSGLYESPPESASDVGLSATTWGTSVDLPFDFPYFGLLYDRAWVTAFGYAQFGSSPNSYTWNARPSNVSSSGAGDGACAPLWDRLSGVGTDSVLTWVVGTAPSRRVIVSYENVAVTGNTGAKLTFQMKFFEGSGRIEFAYKPDSSPTTWNGASYTIGMVAPGVDPRWIVPETNAMSQTGHPGNDFRFDPRTIEISGRVLFEKRAPTRDGLGADTALIALSHVQVDLERPGGFRVGTQTTDADGDFTFDVLPGDAGLELSLVASAQGEACVVRTSSESGPMRHTVTRTIAADADSSLGILAIDASADPTGAFRGAVHVAYAIERAHAWVAERATALIPRLDVRYDASATSVSTRYSRTPSLTVSGPSAANDDTWDAPVLIRAYGRHVLRTLAASSGTSVDDAFDAATDSENAFAVGFGHALHAAVTGERDWIDSTGPTDSTTWDLESPSMTTGAAPDVAGAVAAALYDLLDDANETIDRVDSSNGGGARLIAAVESSSEPLTAVLFLRAWRDSGFDALAASRALIGNGVVNDDVFEPNDDTDESRVRAAIGAATDPLALSIGNEDWFDVVVTEPLADLAVEVSFARFTYVTTVDLEILDADGGRITGKTDSGTLPIVIRTGALDPGTYRVRVTNVAGDGIPNYSLQVFEPLRIEQTPLEAWTVDFPFEQPIAIGGGIAPLAFAVNVRDAPAGLFFRADEQRVVGTPKSIGTYDFQVEVTDAGSPPHTAFAVHRMVINDVLTFDLGEFVPFAAARRNVAALAIRGGTAPFTFSVDAGQLPPGIGIESAQLLLSGTPVDAGSYAFSVRGVDLAGSIHADSAIAVVCDALPTKKRPVDLAAGDSACGVYVDAVRGSTISVGFVTSKKRAKRRVRAALIGPDGHVVEGAKIKTRKGKATFRAVSVAASGRYFAVVASDEGESSQFLATAKIAPPKKGKESFKDVESGDILVISVGALEGARLRLKATAPKRTELAIDVLALIDPNGGARPSTGLVQEKGRSTLLETILDVSGTWTLRLRVRGSGVGTVKSSFKLTQPKGGRFSAD